MIQSRQSYLTTPYLRPKNLPSVNAIALMKMNISEHFNTTENSLKAMCTHLQVNLGFSLLRQIAIELIRKHLFIGRTIGRCTAAMHA